MRKDRTEARLTAAALLGRCLLWFPFWMLLLSLREAGAAHLLPCTGVLLAASFLTGVWARYWRQRMYASTLRAVVITCLLLFPLLCGVYWLLHHMTGGVTTVLFSAAVPMIFLAASAEKEPDTLCDVPVYVAYLTLAVIAPVLMRFVGMPMPMQMLLLVTGLESGLFFLLRNQFMLVRMVNRRSVQETAVPPEIRRSNLLLVGGIFAILLLLFCFRTPLVQLLTWMQETAVALVRLLLTGMIRLIAMLGGDAPADKLEIAEPSEEEMLPEAGSGNPLWLLLWVPILLIAVYIWRVFLSDWVYDIRAAAARLLRKLRGGSAQTTARISDESALYTDTETREQPAAPLRKQRRMWRKQLRAWHQMPDDSAKFYAGYQLLLTAPAWQGNLPREADTVREICMHWQQMHGTELDPVTADFQMHRYAELPLPAEAMQTMAQALEAVAKA